MLFLHNIDDRSFIFFTFFEYILNLVRDVILYRTMYLLCANTYVFVHIDPRLIACEPYLRLRRTYIDILLYQFVMNNTT